MKSIKLIHIGVGNVGSTLVRQIIKTTHEVKHSHDVDLIYCGLFTKQAGLFDPKGLTNKQLSSFPTDSRAEISDSISQIDKPFILIDTTASSSTLPLIRDTLNRGGSVVMSNKKPLSGSLKDFTELQKIGGNNLFYETTVGAGLPVLNTLESLISTGDTINSIQGCFSGTLGFIFSQLEAGYSFSQSVKEAKRRGLTEPDPRDDLSGMDVARKVLIMARILGQKIEIKDIKVQNLCPQNLAGVSVEEFVKGIDTLDVEYRYKVEEARFKGKVLRYVATITPTSCNVGLEAVDKESGIGRLKGTDNIIVFNTKRYLENPLIIQGPGAGLEVTAAGVYSNILEACKVL